MLPKVVFTHRNGVQRAARLPEPVTIGRCEQPAFSTAGQQDRPSLTISLPGARWHLASLSISFLRKPLTTLSRSRLGRRSGVGGPSLPIRRCIAGSGYQLGSFRPAREEPYDLSLEDPVH